jgi:arylsulfatase A-like enzyme
VTLARPFARHAVVVIAFAALATSLLSCDPADPARGAARESGDPSGTAEASEAEPTRPSPQTPNIVLILTDDQRWDSLWAMPTVRRALSDHGVTFRNAYVSNPACCPSRASILTGLYSHHTGVWRNEPPHGGVQAFDPEPTIATRLRSAGYRTALVGKYLNGYAGTRIPPGWDEWIAINTGDSGDRYTDYSLNANGRTVRYGSKPESYVTNVLTDSALSILRSTQRPLFLYLSVPAPHIPSTPAPEHVDTFAGGLAPHRPPSFDEIDVTDKPPWVRRLPPLGPREILRLDERQENHFRALLSVDRAVGRIVRALRASNELADTLLVFTSDNGFLWGEHRIASKFVAYEESIRVPLVVRYDRAIAAPSIAEELVLNVDLAPTFAEAAGRPMRRADGESLLPLLRRESTSWRTEFPLEHMGPPTPTYCGVHGQRWVYVRYRRGAEELYDLARDEFQLSNLVSRKHAAGRLERMRERSRHLCSPGPPGFQP